MKNGYVLGFCFTEDGERVVLIEKRRPDWQKGRYNGVGGKMEDGETMHAAMAREFHEETGIFIPGSSWDRFAVLEESRWTVHCFRTWSRKADDVSTQEEERVGVFYCGALPLAGLTNLRWLVPLALDANRPGAPVNVVRIEYATR